MIIKLQAKVKLDLFFILSSWCPFCLLSVFKMICVQADVLSVGSRYLCCIFYFQKDSYDYRERLIYMSVHVLLVLERFAKM